MAIRAKADITISRIIDIKSVTRYYLLQSSSSASPTKPTTNPPASSWAATEPAYTSGATSTLYFVDCTVFTNGTFSYSDVSKSSSYEAAKEAYNKAKSVETRIVSAETKYLRTRRLYLCAQPKQKLAIYRSAVGIISQHEGRRFLMRMASSPSLIIRVKGHLRNSTILLYR